MRYSDPFIGNRGIYTSSLIRSIETYFETSNQLNVKRLRKHLNTTGKKILDIGCGTGSFLSDMKKRNKVMGIEINKDFIPYLKKKGIPYKIGPLEHCLSQLPDKHFDIITLWDVLEHMADPAQSLALIRDKISPGGILIIWTNSNDNFISGISELSYTLSGGRYKYFLENSFNRQCGHNFNFSPYALELLYQSAGYQILTGFTADTPLKKLPGLALRFKIALFFLYLLNRAFGKGKIICHVLTA